MKWKYYNPKFEYEEKFQDVEWPWAGHKFFAYDLIRNIKPKRIVELGTHKGTSFFSFCQAVKDEKLNTELSAVDTWEGDKHAGFYGDEIFQEVNDIKNDYYDGLNIHLVRKTFNKALNDFADDSVDVLHIDGLHTYEAVKHDFELWISKVRKDGIILFHDTAEKKADFGVYKLWDELKEKYKTLEFHHSHGLGILSKGNNKLQSIYNFQDVWQNYYPAVAENKLLHFNLNNKDQEINNLNQAVQQKDEELKNLNEAIRQGSREKKEIIYVIQQKDKRIASLNQIVQKKDQELNNLKQAIQRKDQKLSNLNQIVQQKNQEIKIVKESKFWKARNCYMKYKRKFGFTK